MRNEENLNLPNLPFCGCPCRRKTKASWIEIASQENGQRPELELWEGGGGGGGGVPEVCELHLPRPEHVRIK